MRCSVDRIEENIAVCETDSGELLQINLSDLPTEICEGDIIENTQNGYIILTDETEKRKQSIFELQEKLFKK